MSLNLRRSDIVGSNHYGLQLLLISTLWAMMGTIVTEGFIGSFCTFLGGRGNCDILALNVSHYGRTVMPDQMDRGSHDVPLVVTGMKPLNPIFAKGFQPVHMDKVSAVEGLKHGFETNNHKGWTVDNFSQKLVVLERTFDRRTIVANLGAKRYMKLIHTIEESILKKGNI